MFEDLNKILDDSLMENSELLKEIKIENIKSIETLISRSVGNGSCYTYMLEALDVLESD